MDGSTGHGMTFNSELRNATRDVEWWSVATAEIPQYYSDLYGFINVVGYKSRAAQVFGWTVCHYGKVSGTSCGELICKTALPPGSDPCNGVSCLPYWMLVYGAWASNGDSVGHGSLEKRRILATR